MFFRAYRRSRLRRYARAAIIVFGIIVFLDLLSLLNSYKTFQHNLNSAIVESTSQLPSHVRDQKILICAQFWTSAQVLATHWNDDLIALLRALGTDNVYLSIYESGSLDNTKDFLQQLDAVLGGMNVKRRIILDPTTHADEISKPHNENTPGWIHTPRSGDEMELRRIPYLARLRNKVLEPLNDGSTGMTFDKILFLNDVHFTPSDVLTLLATHGGYYTAACALDFMMPPRYYDTFVLRDDFGLPSQTEFFPFFRSRTSRRSISAGLPIKVQSCWNGMLVMDAAPFMSSPGSSEGITYRGVDDSLAVKHIEGSECCLVHADLIASGAADAGIWVNPAVRVGYNRPAYEGVHDQEGNGWMSPSEYVYGFYYNRYKRWTSSDWSERRRVRKRVEAWKAEGRKLGEKRSEVGLYCLVNQMHTLIWNGWAHVWEDATRNIPF